MGGIVMGLLLTWNNSLTWKNGWLWRNIRNVVRWES